MFPNYFYFLGYCKVSYFNECETMECMYTDQYFYKFIHSIPGDSTTSNYDLQSTLLNGPLDPLDLIHMTDKIGFDEPPARAAVQNCMTVDVRCECEYRRHIKIFLSSLFAGRTWTISHMGTVPNYPWDSLSLKVSGVVNCLTPKSVWHICFF